MTEQVCFHMFDAYKVVDIDGNETMIAGQTEIPYGTHYGHCIFCKRWIDLAHARVPTKEEMEKYQK